MTNRGKARSQLAPIKDLIRSLELNNVEGARFTSLTVDFLRKNKKLQVNDIIHLTDNRIYALARDLLETETTPGKGPTYSQYWPSDDTFRRTLTYAGNPSKIIKLVSYIMRNQRKNMASVRRRQHLPKPPAFKNPRSDVQAGPSNGPGANRLAFEAREASTEIPDESRELASFEDILSAAGKVPTVPDPSNSTGPSSHLATPPITPAASSALRPHRNFDRDSPRLSVEVSSSANTPAVQNFPAKESFRSPMDISSRSRERSPTAFAQYNPRLPTHRDGTLDESSIKAWKQGVAFMKEKIADFTRGLHRQYRAHPTATPEDHHAALEIFYKTVGLDEFLDFWENDLQKHEKRLNAVRASRAALGPSEERGLSRTLSP